MSTAGFEARTGLSGALRQGKARVADARAADVRAAVAAMREKT